MPDDSIMLVLLNIFRSVNYLLFSVGHHWKWIFRLLQSFSVLFFLIEKFSTVFLKAEDLGQTAVSSSTDCWITLLLIDWSGENEIFYICYFMLVKLSCFLVWLWLIELFKSTVFPTTDPFFFNLQKLDRFYIFLQTFGIIYSKANYAGWLDQPVTCCI